MNPGLGVGMAKHVAVLLGGLSAEREVSLNSGAACVRALEERGFKVTAIDVGRDLAAVLSALRPDVCFNALHGRFGEDGIVQGILEMLQIPYTHSGVLASALAMQKDRAKAVMAAAGVPVAQGVTVSRFVAAQSHQLPPPYVVKPVNEGSSVGVVIVREDRAHPPQEIARADWPHGEQVLVEAYVAGREVTCAIVKGVPTDIIELRPSAGLCYDYESKYAKGGSIHVLATEIKPKIYQEVQKLTLLAHQALGCRGVSRADFRYDDRPGGTGALVCLEVNTQPGMTETSLVPELAAHAGYSFGELVEWMVEDASCDR